MNLKDIRCETCRYWKELPTNIRRYGECLLDDPIRDETWADFGCIHHPEWQKLLENDAAQHGLTVEPGDVETTVKVRLEERDGRK